MKAKTRRTPVLIAAAAFLAAALFPLVAGAQETGQAAAPGRASVEPGRRLADLGLTPEQIKALGDLRRARRADGRAFREETARLRGEMFELAKDPQANQAKIDALIDKRAALRAGREKAALRARAERNRIFTPDQLEKLRSFRARRIGRGIGYLRDGRFAGLRAGVRPMARLRAMRHRPILRWRRW
ncbi:MAG: Spy/CpxP family protein refolding chaperone [Candidatus Aminicenantales bacterium]